MTLSDRDIEKIVDGVALRLGVGQDDSIPKMFRDMRRVSGVIRDIGDDNFDRGLSVVRDMGRSFRRINRISGYVGQVITYLVVAAMFGGMLYVFRSGLKACLRMLK